MPKFISTKAAHFSNSSLQTCQKDCVNKIYKFWYYMKFNVVFLSLPNELPYCKSNILVLIIELQINLFHFLPMVLDIFRNRNFLTTKGIHRKRSILLSLGTQWWTKSLQTVHVLLVPDLQFKMSRVWFMREFKIRLWNNNTHTPYCTYLNGGIPVCSYWCVWNWWCLKKPLSQNWQVNGYFRWCTSL